MPRGCWLAALAPFFGGCVTLNEPVLTPQAIAKGQRTIVLVYAAPGPWVITDSESKAESAAKMLPGLSFAVQSFQDDRYKAASESLKKYVPPWPVRELVEAEMLKTLPRTNFPGRFIPVAEASADTTTLRLWDRAADTLDWQNRYFYPNPTAPHPRDYGRFLPWDDALALEVNVLPQLTADDDGNMIPTLLSVTRLIRCQTLRLLWKHEDKADDAANARSLYEFMTLPQQLLDRWRALVPALAEKITGSLFSALHAGGVMPGASSGGQAADRGLPPADGPRPSLPAMAAPPEISTDTVSAQPTVISTETIAAQPLDISTGTVSAPPAVQVSSPTAPAAQP